MWLILGGTVMDPVTRSIKRKDLIIEGDRIEKVEDHVSAEIMGQAERILDAEGLTIAPGLVDTHVHFRDPGFTYKEDIETGARAAARGGFTTVVCMANTNPPVDSVETLSYILEKAKDQPIRIYQTSTVTKGMKGEELVDFEAMAKAGAVGFTDDGLPIMKPEILKEALKRAKALHMPVSLHEEDPQYVWGAGVNRGAVSEEIGYGGADRKAEEVMVERDCKIAEETGGCLCIQHISSGKSLDYIKAAKEAGADIHGEATPHHFTLTEEAVLQYGTNARMNPPLRLEEDRLAIIQGLQEGTIDMIVTDHAPHSTEEKNRSMEEAPSGIIGLETSLGLGIQSLVEPGYLSLMDLLTDMSVNPAKLYHLEPGRIAPGYPADLVIFNETEREKVNGFASKAENSPFIGWELPGRIYYTVCRGKIVYESENHL